MPGAFTFSAIPSGDYSVTIARTGFKSFTDEPMIHLDPGDDKALPDIHLASGRSLGDRQRGGERWRV